MSLNSDLLCSVSSNGDCVAICTPDGVIKFFDILTSNLKLEYVSSTHLQASCTCLSWSKLKKHLNGTSGIVVRKKVKGNDGIVTIENELNDLDLIAIGTSQGAILLYSLSKAALHSQLVEGGHAEKVNDICWCPLYKDSLWSCSDDGYIIEWSLINSKIKAKWKASKSPITSIAVDSASKQIVCSSKTITVWDIETKTKVKSLTGHANDIFRLTFLENNTALAKKNQYFLSAAVNDRIINAWQLDSEPDSKSSSAASLASFTLSDSPVFLDLVNITPSPSKTANNKKPVENVESSSPLVFLNAVTNKGHLLFFKHSLTANTTANSKLKKPIKASCQLQFETHEGIPLKIFGAFLVNGSNHQRQNTVSASDDDNLLLAQQICVIYGSHLAPKIEKLSLSEFKESKVVLKRNDPFKINLALQTLNTKIETPIIGKDLKVLIPGYMAPQTSNVLTANNSKRKSIEPSQIPLEERLSVMGLDSTANGESDISRQGLHGIPKTDNLLVLLVQGLQSGDSKMLNNVLQHKNEKVITKTVKILPTTYVITLVKELNKRLQGHAQSGMGIIKWLKCVLMVHTSYLMSYPDLIESLGSVYEMMNARTKLFPQLSKLQGKLQLVMSQVSSQAESLQTSNDKDAQPLLYYQDSTSEDEQIEDELIPSHSEFDDYPFSDEEQSDEEEDSDEKEDNDDIDVDDNDKIIQKDQTSFKKKKPLKKPASKKKTKSDDDDDDDEDDNSEMNDDKDDEDDDDDE